MTEVRMSAGMQKRVSLTETAAPEAEGTVRAKRFARRRALGVDIARAIEGEHLIGKHPAVAERVGAEALLTLPTLARLRVHDRTRYG
ncbi:hypothetical protein [Crystallibacter degradans]|uniref:hypothetical protein n=1 Tax=Crystallibacter degradans TaxID=2726743 RepID=UPI001473CDDF|nr:hypothetical protein [Arthrobacter sp. SF27]NMR31863.1 hypothetical protein [Arthrobacter sp. SF27]